MFVVGYFGDWTRAAEVLLEPDRRNWDNPSRFKAREILAEIARAGSALADRALRGSGEGSTDRHWDASGVNPTLNQCNAGSTTPGASNQELFAQNFNGLVTSIGNGQVDGLINPPELAQTLNCMHDPQAVLFLNDQGGGNSPLVQGCYAIDSLSSNSMKSSNPYSGFHKEEIAKTLDTTDPNPTKNQGGNVIVGAVAIAENIIGRAVHNGGNGVGAQEEVAYTQNATGVMGVCQSTVRRLLPVECERLMGFPDNWTRIPWKGKPEDECPDSPRYKACGNSMCVNVMQWIGEQIQKVEEEISE